MGDKGLLERAAANLLANAQVHNPQGCRIWVRVRAEGERAVLEVEDDGRGVTPEELSRLQNTPHYMMSDGSAKEQRHGLGLLIVRQIAAAHQGRGGLCSWQLPEAFWRGFPSLELVPMLKENLIVSTFEKFSTKN